jgi:HK97 family phage major capsid protein
MPKLHELKETRATKVGEMKNLINDAEAAGRDLDSAEAKRFADLRAEVGQIEERIGRAEALDEMERRADAEPVGGREMQRELRSYSLANAISGALSGRLTGREAEISQELTRGREARSGFGSGISLAVPTEVLLGSEQRDGQVAGTPSAGGYLVPTTLAALAGRINRPALKVEGLGATVMRGLSGNVELPNMLTSGAAHWLAENADTTRSAVSFGKVAMSPKTVSGEYRMSRRLTLQSGTAVENILRQDIGQLLAQALDLAAIAGTGVSNQPLGLLNTVGIGEVTASAALSDTAADLIAALELDDITGTAAFLTNPTVMKAVRKLKDGQGHTMPVAEIFHNVRTEVTTQVPANLGTGTNKSALIYGLWSELIVGYWSAVDILLNPYHPDVASNGGVLLHAFLDADVVVRHPEAFAYAEV